MTVYGFGEKKTPEAFRNACHKFVFTEVLRPSPAQAVNNLTPPTIKAASKSITPATQQPTISAGEANKKIPSEFFKQALDQASDENGWAHLGTFGSYLTKLRPDFDSRNYGYQKLSDLVKAKKDLFEFEERKVPSSTQKNLYIRIRSK